MSQRQSRLPSKARLQRNTQVRYLSCRPAPSPSSPLPLGCSFPLLLPTWRQESCPSTSSLAYCTTKPEQNKTKTQGPPNRARATCTTCPEIGTTPSFCSSLPCGVQSCALCRLTALRIGPAVVTQHVSAAEALSYHAVFLCLPIPTGACTG